MELPSSDESCGRHFRYRDLIEVGKTWSQHRIDNRPRQLATFEAMQAMCAEVLDRVQDKFGRPELSYAFSSPELDKLVHQNPNPNAHQRGDQHAGCELNKNGKPICARLGLGVDFRCPGVNSAEVAKWVAGNRAFDRLYFYSEDQPFHVSVGPDNTRQIVRMVKLASGRLMPRLISADYFDKLLSRPRTD